MPGLRKMGQVRMIMIIFALMFTPNESKCLELIQTRDFKAAKTLFETLSNSQSETYRFLTAYFSRDAQAAVETYEYLAVNAASATVKQMSRQKLYEFYYARGYYVRASQYEGSVLTVAKSTAPEAVFHIQCGVFSTESNALTLKEKIADTKISEVYLKRDYLNGNAVIRVNIGPFISRSAAEKVKLMLSQKLNINGYIKSE